MARTYDQQDPQDLFSHHDPFFHPNTMAPFQASSHDVDLNYNVYQTLSTDHIQYDGDFIQESDVISTYEGDYPDELSYSPSSAAPSEYGYSQATRNGPVAYALPARGMEFSRRESSQSVNPSFSFADSSYLPTAADMDLFPYATNSQNIARDCSLYDSSSVNMLPTAVSDGAGSPDSSNATSDTEISQESQTPARNHHLYNANPSADGLYHCPYIHEGCGHEPKLLKCEYDKYIDSHLKPFRCPRCINLQFSSMACLLRHEREAHEMHGHAESLCEYPPCSRSLAGNGFRRPYNCKDHMSRLHGWVDDMPVESKKKRSMPSGKISKTKSRTLSKKQQIHQLKEEWAARKACLENLTHSLAPDGPLFAIGLTQIQAEVQTLKSIQNELSKLTASRGSLG